LWHLNTVMHSVDDDDVFKHTAINRLMKAHYRVAVDGLETFAALAETYAVYPC